ncbi:MAG: RNB domain-containing ribonuclease [Desulfobacteraceae bacterium]|nr:RNB domain-containing ribonuclease [Desulfobacteraceae bacterium]
MEPGSIVEFIDQQKIICAVVLETKKMRLRLLTETNREVKLAAARVSHRSGWPMQLPQSREKLVSSLKTIGVQRRKASEQIDIKELWDILHSEQEWIDLPTMTDFCFPNEPDDNHQAAVIRAFFRDKTYFKFQTDRFFPHTAEQVDQIITQKQAAVQREQLIDLGGLWVQKVLKNQKCAEPLEKRTIIETLISYYLYDKESSHSQAAKAILKKAAAGSMSAIFTFLTKIQVWRPNENTDLLRYEVPIEFSKNVQIEAETLCASLIKMEDYRHDLSQTPVITIDGPQTSDFDDALSIRRQDDHFVLGIHIADVAHFIAKGSSLDREARNRASSIYMPDQKIPMLPSCLSDDICSLKVGHARPAISTLVRINERAEILDYQIVPSIIKVHRQLTYQDADNTANEDEAIAAMFAIAKSYRSKRLDSGALIIDLPEISLRLNNSQPPEIKKTERETPGRLLVSEFMILANELAARFLAEKKLPAIFRAQPDPRERLFQRQEGTLFQNWMQRKLLSRFVLGANPEPHSGLGLPSYVTCTSPIRKYTDLITQRQLHAAMGLESAYDKKQIENIITSLDQTVGQVGRLQFRRNRYWLLKALEKKVGQKQEAIVLSKRREGYAILLPNYMIECNLSGAEGIKLKPEDPVMVTIQHVHARNDVLTVVFG